MCCIEHTGALTIYYDFIYKLDMILCSCISQRRVYISYLFIVKYSESSITTLIVWDIVLYNNYAISTNAAHMYDAGSSVKGQSAHKDVARPVYWIATCYNRDTCSWLITEKTITQDQK